MITPEDNVKSFIHTVLTWKLTKMDRNALKLCFWLWKRKLVKHNEQRETIPMLTSTVITIHSVPKLLPVPRQSNKHCLLHAQLYQAIQKETAETVPGLNIRNIFFGVPFHLKCSLQRSLYGYFFPVISISAPDSPSPRRLSWPSCLKSPPPLPHSPSSM